MPSPINTPYDHLAGNDTAKLKRQIEDQIRANVEAILSRPVNANGYFIETPAHIDVANVAQADQGQAAEPAQTNGMQPNPAQGSSGTGGIAPVAAAPKSARDSIRDSLDQLLGGPNRAAGLDY
jgi:hypothetical protein